jgi:hypothetical protein
LQNDDDVLEQDVEIEPPKPHGKKQEILMRGFLFPKVKEIFAVCGTKFGKSIALAVGLNNGVIQKRNAKWRWMAPIYRQTTIGMDYFRGIVPPSPHTEFLETKMLLKYPYLNSQIEFMHTQNPVDLEGPGLSGQVGDEAAKMTYDAYISSRTTVTRTGATSIWTSTPYGKNWFHKKCMEAKDEMEWAIKSGREPTKLFIHAPTSANPFVSAEAIAQARRDLPLRLFEQYYLAKFVDDGNIFMGVRECVRGPVIELDGASQYWLADNAKESPVVIGVDWAKQRDYAVFKAIDYSARPLRVVGFQRFHGVNYLGAVKELYHFAKRFKEVGIIFHDKTGVGEALDDMLGNFPLPFHGFHFSNSSKASIINGLGLTFEKKDVVLPNWPLMLSELDSYEVSVSKSGLFVYNAPSGNHDDTVIALALAVAAANEYSGTSEVRFMEDLPKDEKLGAIDKYYEDLIRDTEQDSPF